MITTRQEKYKYRNSQFSDWIRSKLPSSATGYSSTDIDFVLFNWKTKKVMLIEEKCRKAEPSFNQHELFKFMHKWIEKGIDSDWQYLGYHLIQFENECPSDGKIYLDRQEISEKQLIEFLSF